MSEDVDFDQPLGSEDSSIVEEAVEIFNSDLSPEQKIAKLQKLSNQGSDDDKSKIGDLIEGVALDQS